MTTTHMSYTPKAPSRCTPLRSPEKNLKIFEVIASWRDFCEIFRKKKNRNQKSQNYTHHLFSLVRFTHPCNIYASQRI